MIQSEIVSSNMKDYTVHIGSNFLSENFSFWTVHFFYWKIELFTVSIGKTALFKTGPPVLFLLVNSSFLNSALIHIRIWITYDSRRDWKFQWERLHCSPIFISCLQICFFERKVISYHIVFKLILLVSVQETSLFWSAPILSYSTYNLLFFEQCFLPDWNFKSAAIFSKLVNFQ